MKYKTILYTILITSIIVIFLYFTFIFSPRQSNIHSDSVVTTIHYVSHISDAHQKIINNFNRKYEGRIFIESINLPFEKFSTNERKELLARYLRSKSDRIDVFTVDQIWVPRFSKWSLPLNKYFNNGELINILEYALETCYFNDYLVALPLYIDIAVMYYRDDLLRSISNYKSLKQKIDNSISWIDLIYIGSKASENIQPIFLYPGDSYEGLMCMFVEMIESQGKSLIEGGQIQLSSLEAKSALKMMVDLVNRYNLTPKEVVNSREGENYDTYLNENGLFLRGWPAFLEENLKTVQDKELINKIKYAPTPHFRNGKPVSVFGGWNLMISKYSPDVEEAIIFIKYLLSEEAQNILNQQGGYIPINEEVYYNGDNQKLKFYKQLMNTGVHRPFLQNYTKISDIIVEYLNKAINKELSVKQALARAEQIIKIENIEIK